MKHGNKSWAQAVEWLRTQPNRRELVLSGYYDDPLIDAAGRYAESEEWGEIRRLLPTTATGRALDIGAGRGIASFALAKHGYAVTALEPDGSAVVGAEAIRALAREQSLSIDVIEAFSERLPLADDTFDVVFGRAVLHHTRDLAATCRQLCRVLKPGGRFIAVREHVISRDGDLSVFLERHPLHWYYGGENAFRLDYYTKSIRSAGFHLDRVLGPFQSPINFAPHSLAGLQRELAERAAMGWPAAAALCRRMLGARVIWQSLLPLLELVDHRPGRLYSFVAHKP